MSHDPFKPTHLLHRLSTMMNEVVSPIDHDGYMYSATIPTDFGRDTWSVHAFVEVKAPDGTTHRLRLEIDDLPQNPGDVPLRQR